MEKRCPTHLFSCTIPPFGGVGRRRTEAAARVRRCQGAPNA